MSINRDKEIQYRRVNTLKNKYGNDYFKILSKLGNIKKRELKEEYWNNKFKEIINSNYNN